MSRRDLPPEVSNVRLSFAALVETLRKLEGERAVLNLVSASPDPWLNRPLMTLVGPLQVETRSELRLLVGDQALLAGDDPDNFVGGTLALRPEDVQAATLTTRDVNDYFILALEFREMTVIIQDDGSGVW